jgi:DNA repair exonuclease SbcCD ATPase subunit
MTTQIQPGSPEWLSRKAVGIDWYGDSTRPISLAAPESFAAGLRAAADRIEQAEANYQSLLESYDRATDKNAIEVTGLDCRVRAAESELFTASQTILRLEAERDRLREAIENCLKWANGHQGDWGDRARNAFSFIEAAIDAARKDTQ